MDTLQALFNVIQNTYGVWLPVVIFLVGKYFPAAEGLFRAAYVTADEIQAITKEILIEFPLLPHVTTVDDIATEVKRVLGDKYKKIDNDKLQNQIVSTIQKQGLSVDWAKDKKIIGYNVQF